MPSWLVPPNKTRSKPCNGRACRAAKADPERRFHALYDKVHRRDILERAWVRVRANQGAPGIDRTTIADVEAYGAHRLLEELSADVRGEQWRPLPARRVWIPKPGGSEQRPLSIPAVRDRIVQAAAKIVIEPVFEADFLPCSFGFRPKRAAHGRPAGAYRRGLAEARGGWRGRSSLRALQAIPHERSMQAIEERARDRKLLKAPRARVLGAGVMAGGVAGGAHAGAPQGGVVSPLLRSVYLQRLERAWRARPCGRLARLRRRPCGDARKVAGEAQGALAAPTATLAGMGLRAQGVRGPGPCASRRAARASTSSVSTSAGRGPRAPRRRHALCLARRPSEKAMRRVRDRVREPAGGRRPPPPVEVIAGDVNRVLARLVRLLPLGKLGAPLRQDQEPRAGATGAGDGETPSPHAGLRPGGRRLPVGRPARPDRSGRNRCRPQARRALAGKAERRR